MVNGKIAYHIRLLLGPLLITSNMYCRSVLGWWSKMVQVKGIECKRCGKCCIEEGGEIYATLDDALRWRKQGRRDILRYLAGWNYHANFDVEKWGVADLDLWFDPITGDELFQCPFLKKMKNQNKYRCTIHETKPEICREFPKGFPETCRKCHLNFVKYSKIDRCPRCGEPILLIREWALKNCPAVKNRFNP